MKLELTWPIKFIDFTNQAKINYLNSQIGANFKTFSIIWQRRKYVLLI